MTSLAITVSQSDLSPIRAKVSDDRIVVSAMIRKDTGWKKFSISCESPRDLWNAIQNIHRRGAEALVPESVPDGSSVIAVDFQSIEEKIQTYLASGKVKKCPPGASSRARLNPTLDIDALLAGLDVESV